MVIWTPDESRQHLPPHPPGHHRRGTARRGLPPTPVPGDWRETRPAAGGLVPPGVLAIVGPRVRPGSLGFPHRPGLGVLVLPGTASLAALGRSRPNGTRCGPRHLDLPTPGEEPDGYRGDTEGAYAGADRVVPVGASPLLCGLAPRLSRSQPAGGELVLP